MNLKKHKETEEERKKEKIRELAELRNGVIDADGCFRELYPKFRNDPTLNYSRWFMAYRDGFEGMPNNFEGRDNPLKSHYELGLKTREIIFGL